MMRRISSSTRGKARIGRSVASSVAYGGLDPTWSSGIFTKMARAAGRSGGLDPPLPKNQPHGFDRPDFGSVPGHEDCVEPEEDEDEKDEEED
jgi:hypothetical protein